MYLSPFRYNFFFRPPRFFGTFFPLLRASERPIAIACLRLLTFLPLRPLLSVRYLFFRVLANLRIEPEQINEHAHFGA